MSLCEECKVPAAVGWGTPAVWLCMEHFEEKLSEQRVLLTNAVRWLCEDMEGKEVIVEADYSQEPA